MEEIPLRMNPKENHSFPSSISMGGTAWDRIGLHLPASLSIAAENFLLFMTEYQGSVGTGLS